VGRDPVHEVPRGHPALLALRHLLVVESMVAQHLGVGPAQRLALLLEVVPGPDRRTALLGGEVPVRAVLEHAPMGPVVVATDGACLTGVLERPATRGAGVLAEVLPAPVPLGPAGDLRRRAGQGGPTGGAPGA